ncbi:MAG: lactate utilization protein [Rhizobiaceae bacterium]
MTPREAILGKIRNQISGDQKDASRRAAVANRLSNAPRGVIPKRGQLAPAKQKDLFCKKAEAVQASVERVSSYGDIGESIGTYLRERNLPQSLRMGEDPRFDGIDWSKAPSLTTETGPSDGSHPVGLSHATYGVAETGSLIMTSGSDNPTTLNFLPENHIVILNAEDIEGDYESVHAHIREHYGKGRMPRTINMITGPSRSADIEQKLLLGAHGPRSLHIIVVDG